MANLCSSRITFYSESEDSICALKQKIEAIQEGNPTQKNDFGSGWLGDFVNTFYPDIDALNVECRGVLTDIDEEVKRYKQFYKFDIWTQTAWTAKIGMWHKILEDFFPNVKLAYVSEESGCEYFIMWDPDDLFEFCEYYFDICCPSSEGEMQYSDDHEFMTLNDIYEWLDKHLPFEYTKSDNICELEEEILEKLDQYDDDECYCTIAKYEKISPSEFDFYRR